MTTHVPVDQRRREILAAARRVCARHGVARLTLRAAAAEAGIPLGTLQYVFRTKAELLRALVEDVDAEIDTALHAGSAAGAGLAEALRAGITNFWRTMVLGQVGVQQLQYELTLTALRSADAPIAAWQYRRYAEIIEHWCRESAEAAGEVIAVDFAVLAQLVLATMDGLIIQYVVEPDAERARAGLDAAITMLVTLAAPRPVTSPEQPGS